MTKQKPQTETQELVKAETLLIEPFTETIQKSGLELSKAEKYAIGYAPLMGEVIAIQEIIKRLDKTNPEHAKIAKLASLDIGKICSRLTDKKAADKSDLLLETKHIDNLFNLATSTARLTQKDADLIVDYLENIERERLRKLAEDRRAELESFGADTSYLPLEIMGDEQYERYLESAKLAFEARRVAAEKAEKDRIEAERLEAERIEKERLTEIERLENERKEAERVKAELERIEAEKAAELQMQKERAECYVDYLIKDGFEDNGTGEAWSKNGSWLIKWDKLLFIDNEEFQDEVSRINKWLEERAAMEDAQRRHDEQLAKEREATRIEQERLAKENEAKLAEQKRLAEIERQKQQAELDKQKAESDRIAKELQAKKDQEQKELEAKRLAQIAPDKEKINALYKSIQAFAIPEFQSNEAKEIGKLVRASLDKILVEIKTESQKLK